MGRNIIDLTGKRYGKLTVVKRAYINKGVYWECFCDCGNMKIVLASNLRRKNLGTKSCGCHWRVARVTHRQTYTRLYKIWECIKKRCNNPNVLTYKHYGGRGIAVCDKWLHFEGFWEDMKEDYADNLSIDRIDNNKGYFKDNCKWSTRDEQSNNKRSSRKYTHDGITLTITQWSKQLDIKTSTLFARLNKGLSFENAIKK